MQSDHYEHVDRLSDLDQASTAGEKLALIHAQVQQRFPSIARMAVATYDAEAGVLRTFAHSGGANPLAGYEARLADTSSLRRMLGTGRPRVVNHLSDFRAGTNEHTRRLWAAGYRASYTLPLYRNGVLWAFLFFDSTRAGVFTEGVITELDVSGHLVSGALTHDLASQRMLRAALDTAVAMVHRRDPDTGAHLRRMARFARLIACELSAGGVCGVDDEFAERLFLFAPLHDVGKIAIPDRILRKPGRLTADEFALMKTHTVLGARIVDDILANFGLGAFPPVDMLRHVAELHHEAWDGSGYPHGLRGGAIPLEARIVAAADVFDALASARPYKARWTNDRAFARLRRLAHHTLDPECVRALIARRGQVEEIQARFRDPAEWSVLAATPA
jgi:HD-GYP domain-containing protein (c-di-GMP phosphodiesterase class II)